MKDSGIPIFFKLPRITKSGLKRRRVREMRRKIQHCSTVVREKTFGSSYREVRKIKVQEIGIPV